MAEIENTKEAKVVEPNTEVAGRTKDKVVYRCRYCRETFSNSDALMKHLRLVHNEA